MKKGFINLILLGLGGLILGALGVSFYIQQTVGNAVKQKTQNFGTTITTTTLQNTINEFRTNTNTSLENLNNQLVAVSSSALTTSTGLKVANFASANISQWTNDSGYVTSSASSFPTSSVSVDSSGGATTSIPTGSDTVVNLKTKVWDFLSEFTTSTNTFTAKNTGYYLVSASIHYASTSGNTLYDIYVYNASTTGVICNSYSQAPSTNQETFSCTGMALINASNTVQLHTSQGSGLNQLVDGVRQTKMEVFRLF